MNRDVKVSLTALNVTLQYLVTRPYAEVVDIIGQLKATIREVQDEEKKTEEEPNPVTTTQPEARGSGSPE